MLQIYNEISAQNNIDYPFGGVFSPKVELGDIDLYF